MNLRNLLIAVQNNKKYLSEYINLLHINTIINKIELT